MRQIRLFTPQPLAVGATVTLDSAATNHLVKVLRARAGDAVVLFNGSGQDFAAVLERAGKRDAELRIGEAHRPDTESPLHTHLGLCLSKGERFDWAIQKATELGVSAITPLISERVEVRLPAERLEKKAEHWRGIARSACEQCQRSVVPTVHPVATIDRWAEDSDCDLKLVLHHHRTAALPDEETPASVALLVGPEGGLSEAEVAAAEASGFQRWCLGPRVLRTETAPVVSLTALGLRWGDLGAR